jgi:hypothetical protein
VLFRSPVSQQLATVFDLWFAPRHGIALTGIVQELLERDAAGDLDLRISFVNRGTGPRGCAIALLGQYLGDEAALRRLLGPVLALRPTRQTIRQSDFWSAQNRLAMVSDREALAARSLVPGRWLMPDTVAAVVDWIQDWNPGLHGNLGHVTLFAMGGRVAQLDPHETAFPHRNATFIIDVSTIWTPDTPPETVHRLLHQTTTVYRRLSTDLDTSAAYVNFPDPDLSDHHVAYYGANYDRLVQVKQRYDPHRVFTYRQGIGTTPPH